MARPDGVPAPVAAPGAVPALVGVPAPAGVLNNEDIIGPNIVRYIVYILRLFYPKSALHHFT